MEVVKATTILSSECTEILSNFPTIVWWVSNKIDQLQKAESIHFKSLKSKHMTAKLVPIFRLLNLNYGFCYIMSYQNMNMLSFYFF